MAAVTGRCDGQHMSKRTPGRTRLASDVCGVRLDFKVVLIFYLWQLVGGLSPIWHGCPKPL